VSAPHTIRDVFRSQHRGLAQKRGERGMKDTVHGRVHDPVHLRCLESVARTKSSALREVDFGRGPDTVLDWSDPTFWALSRPKTTTRAWQLDPVIAAQTSQTRGTQVHGKKRRSKSQILKREIWRRGWDSNQRMGGLRFCPVVSRGFPSSCPGRPYLESRMGGGRLPRRLARGQATC
jgi:hypothetical protein